MTAREAALKALYDIETKDTFINAALKTALNKGLSENDRGLATELIYGVVLNKMALDYIISKYSKVKLKKMSPWVINILRLGVFQIYYMDKIPHSAACNESVKLANKYSHRAGTGFVNGVLRAFSREAEDFKFPKENGIAQYFSLKYSYPVWMVEKFLAEYGEERCEVLFEENRRSHGVFLRVNILKNSVEQALATLENEGLFCAKTEVKNCLKATGKISIDSSKAYSEGLFSLQNISSQKTVEVLEPKAGETVIDMCAAPGGKSCAIAEKMENRGRILAFDIFEHKVELIRKSTRRLGIEIIDARLQDATEECAVLYESADRVLVDAPCSGLGVIHKKPDIKLKRTAEDIEELCQIQKRILNTADKYLKAGGTLVYSTCTILPEENRVQIENFLNEHKEYRKIWEEQILTTESGESGFYICKMVKEKNED